MSDKIAITADGLLTGCAILTGSEVVGLGAGIAWTLAAAIGAKAALSEER